MLEELVQMMARASLIAVDHSRDASLAHRVGRLRTSEDRMPVGRSPRSALTFDCLLSACDGLDYVQLVEERRVRLAMG